MQVAVHVDEAGDDVLAAGVDEGVAGAGLGAAGDLRDDAVFDGDVERALGGGADAFNDRGALNDHAGGADAMPRLGGGGQGEQEQEQAHSLLSVLRDQFSDESGPARLVAGAEPFAGVAVEVLEK